MSEPAFNKIRPYNNKEIQEAIPRIIANPQFHTLMGYLYPVENHKSIPITADICNREDIIIVMEGWQLSAVQKKFPACKDKCYLLAQFELNSNKRQMGYEKYNIDL